MNSQADGSCVASERSANNTKRKYKKRARKFSSRRVSRPRTKVEEEDHLCKVKLDEEGFMVDDIPTYDSCDDEQEIVNNLPTGTIEAQENFSQSHEKFQVAGPGDDSKNPAADMKKNKKIRGERVGTRFSERTGRRQSKSQS